MILVVSLALCTYFVQFRIFYKCFNNGRNTYTHKNLVKFILIAVVLSYEFSFVNQDLILWTRLRELLLCVFYFVFYFIFFIMRNMIDLYFPQMCACFNWRLQSKWCRSLSYLVYYLCMLLKVKFNFISRNKFLHY